MVGSIQFILSMRMYNQYAPLWEVLFLSASNVAPDWSIHFNHAFHIQTVLDGVEKNR